MRSLIHRIVHKWRRPVTAELGLLTKREFERAVARERMRATRRSFPFCVLTIRLLNSATNLQRRQVTRLLLRSVRQTDDKGRLESHTFGVLFVDTPEMGGRTAMSRLQGLLETRGLQATLDLKVYDPQGFGNNDDAEHRDDDVGGGRKLVLVDAAHDSASPNRAYDVPRGSLSDMESLLSISPGLKSIVKRWLDVVGGSAGLLVAAPMLAITAVAVRATSRGPIFFTQQREGQHGKTFTIYKIRTMVVDAEGRLAAIRDQSERQGPAFKMRNDPRVTAVGRFLRASCLDELPQLWNVVKGDMSLVGPRPLPVEESRACKPWHRRRLDVRPGMTCIWQVNKRRATSFDEWMRMDLSYVDNATLWQDFTLLAKTVTVPLTGRGGD